MKAEEIREKNRKMWEARRKRWDAWKKEQQKKNK